MLLHGAMVHGVQVLNNYREPLRAIFRFFSSQGGKDIAYMNVLKVRVRNSAGCMCV